MTVLKVGGQGFNWWEVNIVRSIGLRYRERTDLFLSLEKR